MSLAAQGGDTGQHEEVIEAHSVFRRHQLFACTDEQHVLFGGRHSVQNRCFLVGGSIYIAQQTNPKISTLPTLCVSES
jgi:hypothetical protein